MSRVRVQVTVSIQVLSPLHVGSGLDRTVDAVRGAEGANTAPRVAAIQRDVDGTPYLPGSTIKGLLRRLAGDVLGKDEAEALLGSVERRGVLIVSGAAMSQAGHAERLPYADRSENHAPGALQPGVFVAAGTRIERASGVAASSSLRHEEAVAPGGIFPLAFTIEERGPDAEARCDAQLMALLRILSVLSRPAGQAVGAGQATGDGRVCLHTATLTVTKAMLGSDGELVSRPQAVTLPYYAGPECSPRRWPLLLECEGPFAVLDPPRAQQRLGRDNTPALSAQRSSETTPVLPGPSVTGALRARAAWVAALASRRAGKDPQRDDPPAVIRPLDAFSLTSVQRLFGITGYRGLLEIEELAVLKPATPWQVFSVKLDRFSGGPMSGGLFETAAFLGVRARLVLRLREPSAGIPTPEDVTLAEALIDDLCRNGLTLGHGGNKGFGWFTVTEGGPMPAERDVLHWLRVAQQQRGDVRARLVAIMAEEMDEEDAETLADLVMARLGPAAPVTMAPLAPARQASARATAASNLPDRTSPYRFVELNQVIIPAPEAVREADLDLPLAGAFSGEICVDWVAETPLLIGPEHGAGAQQEVVPLRLAAQGDYAIPGATLKGLLRAGVEIITLGRLSQLNREHRFGLRDFGDDHYRMDETGHSRLAWEKLGAGWLEQRAANPEERTRGLSDYCITPCDKRTVRIRTLPLSWFPGTTTAGDRHLRWLRLGLAAKYGCAGMYSGTYDFSAARACPFVVPKDGDVVPAPDGQGTPGIYVFSGPLPLPANMAASELDDEERVPAVGNKKKREYVFLEHAAAESVRIPQHVFDAFELINSTPSGRGLEPTGSWRELKPTLTAGHRIPVFILGDLKSQQFDFGLTRSFKVAHARSVGGVLDVQTRRAHRLRADMVPDWAEALFGSVVEEDDLLEPGQPRPRRLPGEAQPPSKLARKGRVAVGFARATTPATLFPAPPTPAISTTMMGPRASFAPHYLVGAIKHWSDTGAGLAGRKRYFPRFAGGDTAAAREMVMADRTLPPQRGDGTVSRLRFLVPASGQAEIGFTGSIRVHNLLAEELGALLWVLTHGGDVGGPTRHMIGRAKAFGAGQTRVAAVRLNLHGHDDAADKQLGGAAPLQTFLAAFEAAMDQAVRAAGLRGRWAEQAQVGEWLGLSDPTWGKEERQRVRAHYPGAVAATRNGQPGMDMSQGPREHMKLRREVGNRNIGALRWLATPRRVPKPR